MTNILKPKFPVMLRKMWSGGEVQQWLDEQDLVHREAHRKQVLLEAAEVSRDAMHTTTRDGYNLACSDIRDELRRMAEGEKHE
jgi:hypothetical protein